MNAQVPRLDVQAVVDHWWKRGESNKFRVQLEQDVVHGRVAPDGYVLNVLQGETEIGFSLFWHLHPFLIPFLILFLLLRWVRVFDGFAD